MTQIILNGIQLSDLLDEFRNIVKDEVSSLGTSSQTATDKSNKHLTAAEAAKYLGIAKQTLYQNIEKVPHTKRFGKLYFLQSDLENYLKGGQAQ